MIFQGYTASKIWSLDFYLCLYEPKLMFIVMHYAVFHDRQDLMVCFPVCSFGLRNNFFFFFFYTKI